MLSIEATYTHISLYLPVRLEFLQNSGSFYKTPAAIAFYLIDEGSGY
jgi:hypothetical protein